MKVWMGAEVAADIGDSFRVLRNEIEQSANDRLAPLDYGPGVVKWVHVSIILPQGDSFPEIVKYDRRRKVAECRLKIDYRRFRDGDPRRRQGLICESLLASIDRCSELKANDFECVRFRNDVDDLCRSHGWVSDAPV